MDDPNIHPQRRHTTAMDSSPTPWEEVNLANTWDITHTQLSRPTTESHLIAWRPDGGGSRGLCTSGRQEDDGPASRDAGDGLGWYTE